MSNRSLLDEPCDLHAELGSKPWARAVAREIRCRAKQFDTDVEGLQSMISIAAQHEAWRPLGYMSLDAFLIAEANFTQAIIDAVRNAKKGTTVGEAIAARENPLASGPGKPKGSKGGNQYTVANVDNTNKSKPRGGTDTTYTLRRLARDNPAMLDKIEAGELSVNQAAIQAGIRKKPQPSEQCLKAWVRSDDRISVLKKIVETLTDTERVLLQEFLSTSIKG